MRVPRIAGVDAAWALALMMILPFSVFLYFDRANSFFDAYNFDPVRDLPFALLFFAHGVFVHALLVSSKSTGRVNRFLIKQGLLFCALGIVLNFFWPANFFVALGLFYLLSRVAVYLDNQILRFMIIITAMVAVLLYSFSPDDAASGVAGRVPGPVMLHLTDHHFNPVFWLPIFLAGMVYGRSDYRLEKRRNETRLMSLMFLLFGVILHVTWLRFFPMSKPGSSFWGIGLAVPLPAFYAYAIGVSQLAVTAFESAFHTAPNRSAWNKWASPGRLHLSAILLATLLCLALMKAGLLTDTGRALAAAMTSLILIAVICMPKLRRLSDPLILGRSSNDSKSEESIELEE